MTIPVWVLLAFAAWTLFTVGTTHGVYRWGRVLTGRAKLRDFGEYEIAGERGWYERGMRAHANCVENLPVLAAIVVAAVASGTDGAVLDGFAITVIAARVPHTLVHVLFEQTDIAVGVRSALYHIQFVAMSGMIAAVVLANI